MLSDLRFRLRALFDRRAMERELDDELKFHLDQEIAKNLRAGMPAAEAERRARLAFGGLDRIKDDTRDARGIALIDAVGQDLRYAWRGLRAKPGFTAAIVVTLGLGIGANTAMFGIVDRLLFRPPPYMQAAERVHRVYMPYLWQGEERIDGNFSYLRYDEVARLTRSFDVYAAVGYRDMAVGLSDAREMRVGTVSASMFELFDVQPVLGRFFANEEDRPPAGDAVAVLGYGYWHTRYGGRTDVLGQRLHLGSQVFTVIGVAPPGFVGTTESAAPVAFVPITAFAAGTGRETFHTDHSWSWLEIVVRRKPDVSVAAADADLSAALARSWDDEVAAAGDRWPDAEAAQVRGLAGSLLNARAPGAGPGARIVAWIMGVALIVLLVACANVANLLLARAARRRREIALRLALGVSRGRLLQQLFTESLLLALLGGAAGLLTAQWGGRVLRALFLPAEQGGVIAGDSRTLLFATLLIIVVALLTGLAPALHVLRSDVAAALKAGMREGVYRRSRTRSALLVLQAAMSVVLLIGAGLFVRSLAHVRALRIGYDIDPVIHVNGNLRGAELTVPEIHQLIDRLVLAAETTPGVQSASPVTSVPFWGSEGRGVPFVPGVDSLRGRFTLQAASPSYFATMGTRILRGRGIEATDRAGSAPVVVVSEGMANAIWPNGEAIGRQMRVGSDTLPFLTVVGIAEDIRARQLSGDPEFWYYVPLDQYRFLFGSPTSAVLVRVEGRAEQFVERVRSSMQEEMPGAGYVTARPLRELIAPQHRSWEFGATMFAAFGALALVLAAIGLYSVIAFGVEQRRQELGIRLALGARPADVVRMVVGQGLGFALAGVSIGAGIALFAGRWLEPLLFSQSPYDVRVFGAVALLMLLVAVIATMRPTWRAAHVDPTTTLRMD